MLKFSGSIIWRLGTRATIRKYSIPGATLVKNDKLDLTRNVAAKSPKSTTESNDTSGNIYLNDSSNNYPVVLG